MGEQKEPGKLKQIWRTLRGGKKLDWEKGLAKGGVDIVKTDQLGSRLEVLHEFNNYVNLVSQMKEKTKEGNIVEVDRSDAEKRLGFLLTAANNINEMVHKLCFPWLFGGDKGYGATVNRVWAIIHSKTIENLMSNLKLVRLKTEVEAQQLTDGDPPIKDDGDPHIKEESWRIPYDKSTLADQFEYFFTEVYLSVAARVVGLGWKENSVVPDTVVLINNIPQQNSGMSINRDRMPGIDQ